MFPLRLILPLRVTPAIFCVDLRLDGADGGRPRRAGMIIALCASRMKRQTELLRLALSSHRFITLSQNILSIQPRITITLLHGQRELSLREVGSPRHRFRAVGFLRGASEPTA